MPTSNMQLISNVSTGHDECPFNIEKVEQHYNAKFVGMFCPKTTDGQWGLDAVPVFYVEHPSNPEHTNYFYLRYNGEHTFIGDGLPCVSEVITAIETFDGEVLYSQHRHDYRQSKDGSAAIDGGRDYIRIAGKPKRVLSLRVIDGQFYVIENEP